MAYRPATTPAGEHKGRVLSIRANPRIQSLSQSCLAGFVQWLGLADRSQGNAWGNAQIALESSRTRFPLPLPANSPLERPLSAPAALPRAARAYSRRPLLANAAMAASRVAAQVVGISLLKVSGVRTSTAWRAAWPSSLDVLHRISAPQQRDRSSGALSAFTATGARTFAMALLVAGNCASLPVATTV